MSTTLYAGDTGTILRAELADQDGTALDVSAATTKVLLFKRPDGVVLRKAAAFSTDGTDGKIQCTFAEGELRPAGEWAWQAYVELPTGAWHSTVAGFTVAEPLDENEQEEP